MQSSRVSWGVLEQVNLASDEFLETVKFNVDLQQLNLVDLQQLKMEIPLETPGLGKNHPQHAQSGVDMRGVKELR
jgi:hypothetical protein